MKEQTRASTKVCSFYDCKRRAFWECPRADDWSESESQKQSYRERSRGKSRHVQARKSALFMIVKGGHFGNARVRMTGAKAKVRR